MLSSATAHGAAVHFPIALLIFAAANAVWASRRRGSPPSDTAAVVGAAGAILAVVTGWIHAGDVDDVLLERHRWLGVATAALAVASVIAGRISQGRLSTGLLVLAALATVPTGWLGGDMAHGHDATATLADIAAKPMPRIRSQRQISLPENASDEAVGVEAVRLLKRSCVKCHREGKRKGRLRLDSREAALTGGESGPAVIPGDASSLLLQRVKLDATDEDVMPKRGKLLSPSEMRLLDTWVQRGAPWPSAARPSRP
jgi:hypothetical protein